MSDLAFETPGALRAHQLERLRSLIGEISRTNAFYAPRLRAAGVDSSIESLDGFVERLPFTTKAELSGDQEAHPPYGTNLGELPSKYVRLHQTSSTMGRPLRWLDTPESWSWLLDGWDRIYGAASITAANRVMVAFSFGPFIGLWMAFDAAVRMGCLTIPGGGMSSAIRLRAIVANGIDVLCCTPTYAIHLGEVAQREGIDVTAGGARGVRTILVAGEPGACVPAVRARVESLWPGARLVDHYGMTEVGPVTYECPQRASIVHVMEQMHFAEVVDRETGERIVADGERTGELVLTPLGRACSPVLRYRTGDVVRPLPECRCACGRTSLALDGGILGRADDMVVVRGVNLYPSAVEEIVRREAHVAEYRVELDSRSALAELRIEVEPTDECASPAALCTALEKAFRDAWNLRIPVRAAARGSLPRFELKAKRWVKLE